MSFHAARTTVKAACGKSAAAKRLTRNERGTVFGVISMRWTEVAWFTLVGQKKKTVYPSVD